MFTLIIAIYLIIVLLIIRASFKFINELDSDLTLAFAEKFGFSICKYNISTVKDINPVKVRLNFSKM